MDTQAAFLLSMIVLVLPGPARIVDATDWPKGLYSLLMPETGCPENSGVMWETGKFQIHTESSSGSNTDSHTVSIHMVQPVIETKGGNNLVNLNFCSLEEPSQSNEQWPKGHYCINYRAYVGGCPLGMEHSSVKLHQETTNNIGSESGVTPYRNSHMIYFCCRNDGPTTTPIVLPAAKSFYLYKYGDKCQQVQGMTVREEDIQLDTEDTKNEDSIYNSYTETTYPQGSPEIMNQTYNKTPVTKLNPVVLPLCYYSPASV